MKHLLSFLFSIVVLSASAQSQTDTLRQKVLIQTTMGDIVIALYNETPLHRDNFIAHVKNGDFNGVLFHRVIKDFMIQTGDPSTRPPELKYPNTPKVNDQNVPAEFRFPQLFHKKGAVAAAREGDDTNPERMSSATQFYIVVGKRRTEWELDHIQNRISEATNGEIQAMINHMTGGGGCGGCGGGCNGGCGGCGGDGGCDCENGDCDCNK